VKRFAFLAAVSALSLVGAAAHATTIDTTPNWDGSNYINPFGGFQTGVYGETFTAPGGNLLNYTFYVNTETPLDVVGQVYAWNGSLTGGNGPQGAAGPALFTSAQFTINGTAAWQAVTINTGSLALTTGQHYVALLADVNPNNGTGVWGLANPTYGHPGVANDGGFNFYNYNVGGGLGQINTNNWDDFGDFGSSAWTANFAGGAPEPAEWALMLAGFGLAGGALRARKRAAAAA
jgi:hypothetical protein